MKGIRSQRIVTPQGIGPGTLLFADGRIERLAEHSLQLDGVLDVGGLTVSPGLVDCHVHINEPGRTEWEGFATATQAAAAGGVTTLVDMPLNCIPVTTSADALTQKLAACRGQLHVDAGFWGGVVPGNVEALSGLAEAGALGCKAFMVHSGIDEFPNATETDLRRAMPVLKRLGLPLLAHAELDLGADAFGEPRSYASYLASRPERWEDEAIRLLVRLCEETGCAVHIVHLSSASAVPIVRAAKQRGLPISAETCPHYLCLTAEEIPDGATHFKCAPPIRSHQNREALWQALFEGVIDFVITDHSPCTPALKLPERGDFQAAWGGIASLSLGLSSIWTEASARGATPRELARWMSQVPAQFAGLAAQKGRIAPGFAADLVVWDPDESFVVETRDLHFRHKISPYVGRTLRGRVHMTLLGGALVHRDGATLGEARGGSSSGASVRPGASSSRNAVHLVPGAVVVDVSVDVGVGVVGDGDSDASNSAGERPIRGHAQFSEVGCLPLFHRAAPPWSVPQCLTSFALWALLRRRGTSRQLGFSRGWLRC